MRDLPHGFDIYLVNVKTTRKIAQIFVTFSGLENLRNLPHGFYIYLVNVKTMKKIAQIFVAFSEKLNFTFGVRLPDFLGIVLVKIFRF